MENLEFKLLNLTLRLFAVSIFIQQMEYSLIYLKNQKNKFIKFPFFLLNIITLCISCVCIFDPHISFAPYFLASLMIQYYQFQGLFNGGSSSMSHQVALALNIGFFLNHLNLSGKFVLYYIGIQGIFSYWIAGIVKLIEPDWRSGHTLRQILLFSNYQIPLKFKIIAQNHLMTLIASWVTIIFELFFPISLLNKNLLYFFLFSFFIFHIMNAIVFGLNRFIFAWLAAYPAIYFISTQL